MVLGSLPNVVGQRGDNRNCSIVLALFPASDMVSVSVYHRIALLLVFCCFLCYPVRHFLRCAGFVWVGLHSAVAPSLFHCCVVAYYALTVFRRNLSQAGLRRHSALFVVWRLGLFSVCFLAQY